ncbi:hypothetical protein LCGC14_2357550 [marine sediment metagenome]|uniref:DUF1376 domain-containing protein n=1 Tax=marine sediment metagenome TaxID=412755 RepID=A0A0F9F2I2_9ZZZZ
MVREMSEKSPAFLCYAKDLLVSTGEMTNAEFGAYWRNLCYQWVNGSIDSDPNRHPIKYPNGEWEAIFPKFHLGDDGRLRNKRLEEVRLAREKYLKKQSDAGKKGADKRWLKDGKPNGDPINDPNAKEDGFPIPIPSSSESSAAMESKTLAPKRRNATGPKPYRQRVNTYFENINQEQRTIWGEAYPNIDLDQEFRKAKSWLLTNTNKAKRDFPKFVNNWLAKAMDYSKATGSGSSRAEMPDHIIGGSAAEKRWLEDHGLGAKL